MGGITIPCILSKTITVPPGGTALMEFVIDDTNDPDAYIRDTPAPVLEQLNVIRRTLKMTNDDYHSRNYANRHELYLINWTCQDLDESLRDYLYDFCEIKNRKDYREWIYNRFIYDNDDIRDIMYDTKRLFRIKEYCLFNDFDDDVEYVQKCVNFLCNFVFEADYARYKLKQ